MSTALKVSFVVGLIALAYSCAERDPLLGAWLSLDENGKPFGDIAFNRSLFQYGGIDECPYTRQDRTIEIKCQFDSAFGEIRKLDTDSLEIYWNNRETIRYRRVSEEEARKFRDSLLENL